jgi:hypothetical protein
MHRPHDGPDALHPHPGDAIGDPLRLGEDVGASGRVINRDVRDPPNFSALDKILFLLHPSLLSYFVFL